MTRMTGPDCAVMWNLIDIHAYAPDSAKAEGSSIVDEPGEG